MATTIAGAAASISRNGTVVASVSHYSNVVGVQLSAGLQGGPLVLVAGETLSTQYSNGDNGGFVGAGLVASGFLFDA